MKNKFIYFDLNELQDNRGIVINPITFKEIIDTYGQAVDDMDLYLWSDDLDDNNKFNPMVYQGKFVFDQKKNNWFIEINPDDIEHHLTSIKYSNYSLEEIMGESYLKEKRSHPEWF